MILTPAIRSLLRNLVLGILVCSLLAPLIALPVCTAVWVAILQHDRRPAHSLPELWALTTYVGNALFTYMSKSLAMFGAVLGVIQATLLHWTKSWGRKAQTWTLICVGAFLGGGLGSFDGSVFGVVGVGLYGAYCGLLLGLLGGSKASLALLTSEAND